MNDEERWWLLYYLIYNSIYSIITLFILYNIKNKIIRSVLIITNVLSLVFWMTIIYLYVSLRYNVFKGEPQLPPYK